MEIPPWNKSEIAIQHSNLKLVLIFVLSNEMPEPILEPEFTKSVGFCMEPSFNTLQPKIPKTETTEN